MEDKKKIAAVIIAGLKPKGDVPPEGDKAEESGQDSDLETAGSEVMDAMKSGDSKSFTEALKAFCKLCDYSGSEDKGE